MLCTQSAPPPRYSSHLQGKIPQSPNQVGRICTNAFHKHTSSKQSGDMHRSLREVSETPAQCRSGFRDVWLCVAAPDDAAPLSVTANSLTKAKFAHSIFSNFFSFHRRTKEKSALCRGMWPSDMDVGKKQRKVFYIWKKIYIYRQNSNFFQNFFVKIPKNFIKYKC